MDAHSSDIVLTHESPPVLLVPRTGGRAAPRAVLSMAALTAIVHNPMLKAFYQNLRARGKLAKVALTAVMRKLIILLNHMLKNPNFSLA